MTPSLSFLQIVMPHKRFNEINVALSTRIYIYVHDERIHNRWYTKTESKEFSNYNPTGVLYLSMNIADKC
jgi:hypothetical protein